MRIREYAEEVSFVMNVYVKVLGNPLVLLVVKEYLFLESRRTQTYESKRSQQNKH